MYDETDRSQSARKSLAEATKALKSKTDDEKLATLGTVLKQYQDEINQLTRRSKFAEFSFLTLYKQLFEAPDPAPLLVASKGDVGRLVEQEQQIGVLNDKLKSYDIEFTGLKNQDVTIRKLESENRALQASLEQQKAEAEERRAADLQAEVQTLQKELLDNAYSYEQKLNALRDQLSVALRANDRTAAQLLELQSKRDSDDALAENDSETLVTDLERANATIHVLRREIAELRNNNLDEGGADDAPGFPQRRGSQSMRLNDERIRSLEDEISRLRAELSASGDARREYESKLRDAQLAAKHESTMATSEMAAVQKQLDTAKAQIAKLPSERDFQALQQQLALLQELAYGTGAGIESSLSTAEQLLLQKNRRFEQELARVKAQLESVLEEHRVATEELSACKVQLAANSKLVRELEEDLAQANAEHANTMRNGKASSTVVHDNAQANTLQTILNANGDDDDTFANEDIVAMPLPSPSPKQAAPVGSPTAASGGNEQRQQQNASMLQIVIGQRDRFRERMQKLESESDKIKRQLERVVADANALKLDNVKLYEKLQYVRSYSGSKSGASSNSGGGADHDLEAGRSGIDTGAVERKYKALHDIETDPFREFKKRAVDERINSLPRTERWTLNATRFAASRKGVRTFIFFYAVLLHLLIFAILYSHTIYDHCASHNGGHTAVDEAADLQKSFTQAA